MGLTYYPPNLSGGSSTLLGFNADFYGECGISDEYLKVISNHMDRSDTSPFIIPVNCKLSKISYTGKDVATGFVFEVRLNGSVIPSYTTPTLTGKSGVVTVSPMLSLVVGDLLSLYIPTNAGTKPNTITAELYFV